MGLSYVLVQHENVIDLLPQDDSSLGLMRSLKICELGRDTPFGTKPNVTVQIEGLAEYRVASVADCLSLVRLAERNKVRRMT